MTEQFNAQSLFQDSPKALLEAFSRMSQVDLTAAVAATIDTCTRAVRKSDTAAKPLVAKLCVILSEVVHEASKVERMSVLVEGCSYFYQIGSSFEGIAFGEAARQMANLIGDLNTERRANNILGTVYLDISDPARAAERLERALALARQMDQPLLQMAALANVTALLKSMGLYQDAMTVCEKVLEMSVDVPQSRLLRFQVAGNGLFCAHRTNNGDAGLRYLTAGSAELVTGDIDAVNRATFEFYRALYLITERDHETAEVLINAAQQQLRSLNNDRIDIQLRIAAALCDWASRAPTRVAECKRDLTALYEQTKKSGLYHDEVLRALMEVYSRHTTAADADVGLRYAKELIEYTTSIKRAKFFRQMQVSAAQQGDAVSGNDLLDPLARVRAWLDSDKSGAAGPAPAPQASNKTGIQKHDELSAIHDDLVRMRVTSLKTRIRTAAYDVAENWALAAEFFDDQTGQHCFRVGRLSGMLAREIGQDEEFCVRIEHAARLHDLGKIGVNEMILLKPGPLDPGELAAMRAHTEIGAHLLKGSREPTLQMAALIARFHHEWWGGGGYPQRLSGTDIPLAARICALADVYDALTHRRSYKAAWSHEAAVEQMMVEGTSHFDPHLIQPFLKVLTRYTEEKADPSFQLSHLEDMQANGLLSSRINLMKAVGAG